MKTVNTVYENKTFCFNYSKFFIRDDFNHQSYILDNQLKISLGLNNLNKPKITGYSLVLNKLLYKHKLYKNLKFYWINPNINFRQDLNSFLNNFNSKNYVFFTKIIKGGIECYSSGFKGILPKKELKYIIKTERNNISASKITLLAPLKNNFKFFYFKAHVELTKFTNYSVNIYNLSPKDKNFTLKNNKFNIIFNCIHKQYSYENKKINKKNRKYNFRKKN